MGNTRIIGDRIVDRILYRLWERGYTKGNIAAMVGEDEEIVKELKRMVAEEMDNLVLY